MALPLISRSSVNKTRKWYLLLFINNNSKKGKIMPKKSCVLNSDCAGKLLKAFCLNMNKVVIVKYHLTYWYAYPTIYKVWNLDVLIFSISQNVKSLTFDLVQQALSNAHISKEPGLIPTLKWMFSIDKWNVIIVFVRHASHRDQLLTFSGQSCLELKYRDWF